MFGTKRRYIIIYSVHEKIEIHSGDVAPYFNGTSIKENQSIEVEIKSKRPISDFGNKKLRKELNSLLPKKHKEPHKSYTHVTFYFHYAGWEIEEIILIE